MEEAKDLIKLPKFDYMSQKNTYSGSVGDFRYKFYPEKKDEIDTVFVIACYIKNCYEIEKEAGRVTAEEFEYSPEGIEKCEEWVRNKYIEYCQK